MSMSKKDFIALADAIRDFNNDPLPYGWANTPANVRIRMIEVLADFCKSRNPRFLRDRWLSYIAGECGKNGGKVKVKGR